MSFDLNNYIVSGIMSLLGDQNRKRYLKMAENVDSFSEKLLLGILKKNQDTELGRKLNLGDIHSVLEYQDRVPYSEYEDYREYVERMAKDGEQNLMSADKISFLATTSGTTGVTKRIPVSQQSTVPMVRVELIMEYLIDKSMKLNHVTSGRGLNSIETVNSYTESGMAEGYVSSYAMQSGSLLLPAINCIPKEVDGTVNADMKYIKARYSLAYKDLVYLGGLFMSTATDLVKYIADNKDMLINDIEHGVIDPFVDMPGELRQKLTDKLHPDKERAEELREALDFSRPEGILKRVWPNLSAILAIGSGEFESFKNKMRVYCGSTVHFVNAVYASSEAVFATAYDIDNEDYLMVPDGGFFEFIPVDDAFDEKKDRPLLMHQLEEGKHYEVVVTNYSGLYRYRIKDVIRVVGHVGMIPLIHFAYRKAQLINITGVKLTAEHMVDVMRAISHRVGVQIIDYSVYPDTESEPWRMKVFIEFDGEISDRYDLAAIFDEELSRVNEEHGHMLRIGETSPSVVYVLHRNASKELREENAKKKISDNQVKAIRYINSKSLLRDYMKRVKKAYGKGA